MKDFKILDFLLQLVLMAIGVVLMVKGINFYMGYFLVGGWQLISVLVHSSYKPFYSTYRRKVYLYMLAIVAVAGVLSLVIINLLLVFLTGLLFFSPIMALYYLRVCFIETQWLMKYDDKEHVSSSEDRITGFF